MQEAVSVFEECQPDREEDQYFVAGKMPERTLLWAVLEMAFRDLSERASQQNRRTAIAWFRSRPINKTKLQDPRYTFSETIEYLDLGERELRPIMARLYRAERYDCRIQSAARLLE